MALNYDINSLPTNIIENTTNHLGHHTVVHSALKDIAKSLGDVVNTGTSQDIGPVKGTVILDPPVAGAVKVLTLTGDISVFLKTATPGSVMTIVVTQGAGSPHTVTWPVNISWQDGPPSLSYMGGSVDVITLLCVNGISWLGFVSGQEMTVPPRQIRDSFNRPNNPALGVTDTGQVWVEDGWKIEGNLAHAYVTDARMAVDSGQSENVEVSIEARTGGVDSASNFLLNVRENSTGTTRYSLHWLHLFNANMAVIRKEIDGEVTDMGARFSLGAQVGQRVGLRCQQVGDDIVVSAVVNGTPVATRTDTTPIPRGTYVGLAHIGSFFPVAHVDEFRVDYL